MIKIIRGSEENVDLIVDMISELLKELDKKNSSRILPKTELIKWIRDNMYIVFIAEYEKNKEPVGLITLIEARSMYAEGMFGIIQEFYVKPLYRSQQIGKKLLDHAIDYGRAHKWMRLEVGAPEKTNWMRSYSFYVKNGFVEIGPRLKLILTNSFDQ
jgi:GNAT superfamily N-acetyltransferase